MNKKMFPIAIALSLIVPAFVAARESRVHPETGSGREVAITFDDLPGVQVGGGCNPTALYELNRKLIAGIRLHKIPALGLVVESRLCHPNKEAMEGLLKMWLDAGLELGNHSYSHFDLNNTPLEIYKADVVRGEETTRSF